MSTNHNRIKVSDLETSAPNKILVTNQDGELTFSDAGNLGLGASNFKKENFAFQGSKIFILSEPALNILSVVVDGIILNGTAGAPLQYRMNNSTTLEILDEMLSGEDFWVSITYNYTGSVDGEPAPGSYNADQIAETENRKFQSANQKLFNDATSSIQTQLDTKEPAIPSGVSSQYFRGDKTWQTLDKTKIGLASVDNTADAAKNVLSATKLATARTINGVAFDGSSNITINATDATSRIASSEKGAANGVATLDASGVIPTAQLPSYVDDVLEFTNLAGFPAAGETGKIFVAKDTNKTYRWSGTAYVYITSGAVDSVAGKTGVVTLAKTDVGLASVDNTADAAKNVLSATKLTAARTINGVAFDGSANITIVDATKENSISLGTTTQYFRGDKTWQSHDKTSVGLANVDNTADAAKNVLSSVKLTTARTINGVSFDGSANITINATDSTSRIAASEKGVANGVATLDANGTITASQLPGSVDDVLEFSNLAAFPATGESGKMYVAKDNNKIYRWSGTAYILITSGAVDSVAGKTGIVTLSKADVGLASVDNIADVAKNVLSATKLTTARTINGTAFDGSANITITDTTKENSISAGTLSQYLRGDKTWQPLNTANVVESDNLYFTNARGIASALTGYTSSTGTIAATDTILSAIGKLNGNDTLKAPIASPTFTGTVTAPTFVGTLTGNAASATKLSNPRTINGISFDGSTNITINATDTTARIASSEKGVANGVATLDASGIIPALQLPSYVDDVLEFTNLAGFPATGETGKIYVSKDTNKTYRWSGTAYVYITSGAVDSVAGKTGVVTLTKADVGLASVDNTSDGAKSVLSATKLTTARTINGVGFDGSVNITITDSTKENNITAGTTSQYWRGDKTWQSHDKISVGLGNIDNTADAAKNVLSATKLTTARTINGVLFDGSANITMKVVPHQDDTRSGLNYNTALTSGFYNVDSVGTNGPGTSYNNLIVAKGIDTGLQIAGGHNNDTLWFRGWSSSGSSFTPWRRIVHDGNFNLYSPSLNGAGANGTWGININGSANGSARYVDLLPNRTDAAAYPILWGVNQATNPVTGNASTYAFSCDAVKIQSSTGTVIANNFSGAGTNLTGTAGSLNIGGNAETSTSSKRISFLDGPRTLSDRLPNTFARSVNFDFVNAATVGGSGNYGGVMTFAPWDGLSSSTGDSSYQLAFRNESGVNGSGLPGLRIRKGIDTTWGGWYDILHSGNYTSFSAFSGAITGASLTVSGDVTAFSDVRVKENIRPIENVIEKIKASRGVIYDRIDTKEKNNIGFIAQELEESFPELVITQKDGTKAVKYQNAVALLFEAVKEQQKQIENQDKKLKFILEHLNLKL